MQVDFGAVASGRNSRLLLTGFAAVALLVLFYLVTVIRSELSTLATASSDSVQWNLSQSEVEHLAFLLEVQRAQTEPQPNLSRLRQRFDVFFSRISTIRSGDLYSSIFKPDFPATKSIENLQTFLVKTAVLIDSPDEALIEALPDIEKRSAVARQDIRIVTLEGIAHFSRLRDANRTHIYRTLVNIALLVAGLLIALLVLVFLYNRLSDISRKRLIQNKLANARTSAIVATSLDAVIAINREGAILEYNGAAEDIFGYSKSEAIGAPMAELIIPDHLRKTHEEGMNRFLETGERRVVGKGRVRLEAVRKSGEIFPVEFNINPMPNAVGEVFISYLRDITTDVEAEEALLAARDSAIAGEKSKSKLLAVMSHEMRTPLNGLLGTMELLSDTKLTEPQQRYLQIMDKSGRLLLSHVNDVLDISRLEAGKMGIENEKFDLHALINELIDSQSAVAKNRGNQLTFKPLERGQLLIDGDQLRLRQVLLNLISNAIKFTKNGNVSIEAEVLHQGDQVEIRVTDTGVGMAPDEVILIFDDFTTLDTSYGRQSGGTGLGLGIARRLVDAMGGEIGVESEAGEGSLFWLRVPTNLEYRQTSGVEVTPAQASAQTAEKTISPKEILLVEDNEINRMVARDFLEADGHIVSEAHNGSEGVSFAERKMFDIILMDISMPELDGVAATTVIRNGSGLSKNTPIFALTAHALEEDIQRFREAGMALVISKPISRKTLRAAIGSIDQKDGTPAQNDILEESLIDHQVIDEFRTDIGDTSFQNFLENFLTETDAMLAEMYASQGTNSADNAELARSAHKLAGSAAMFGAQLLRRKLMELEASIASQPDVLHKTSVCHIISIWKASRRSLEKII